MFKYIIEFMSRLQVKKPRRLFDKKSNDAGASGEESTISSKEDARTEADPETSEAKDGTGTGGNNTNSTMESDGHAPDGNPDTIKEDSSASSGGGVDEKAVPAQTVESDTPAQADGANADATMTNDSQATPTAESADVDTSVSEGKESSSTPDPSCVNAAHDATPSAGNTDDSKTACTPEPGKNDLPKPKVHPDGTTEIDAAPITRHRTLMWFGTALLSNLVLSQQSNPGGVTDVLRKLNIPPEHYCNVDNMYRSDAIKLQALQDEWINYVCENCQPYTTGGRILLSGDGVMKPKEGRYAPAVVRLHKESGTQSKPSSFHGIHVGALGIMALGQNHGVYCMPLFMQLMQGLDPVAKWEGSPYVHADMPLELQEIVYMAQAVRIFSRPAYYLTDRASMSANAFAKIAEVNQSLSKEESKPRVDMIVPCRKNVAMYKPVVKPEKPRRGRPATKGDQLSIESFAEDPSFEWRYGRVFIYGSKKKVRYKVANLLWGDTSAKRITLRFVLVDYMDGTPPYMLCSTDLQMGGLNMIKSYARRFLCEEQFKVNKHVFHGFSMHFWSKHIPKNSFIRKGNKNILDVCSHMACW